MLRSDSENIDWSAGGEQPSWIAAARRAHDELGALIVREGRRAEFWVEVGAVPAIVWPAVDATGAVEVPTLTELLPTEYELPGL